MGVVARRGILQYESNSIGTVSGGGGCGVQKRSKKSIKRDIRINIR